MTTIVLSENKPYQSPSPHGGFTVGEQATIWKQDDGWWYCISSIGESGLSVEADDVGPFETEQAAAESAREDYAEIMPM